MKKQIEEKYLFENFEEYRNYLNEAPLEKWIQNRSLGKKNHQFLPLFIMQGNADLIFREWQVIEEKPLSVSNGVAFTVKIAAVPDYPGAETIYFTGSAAVQFKGASNHIEFDLPNARERAVGKAFATLGNIFGRNLNRTYKVNSGGLLKTVGVNSGFSLREKPKNED